MAAKKDKTFKTALDARQMELLGGIAVDGDLAKFVGAQIPDWSVLKKVMTTLGGVWSKKRKGFEFAAELGDAFTLISHAKETGEILDPKLAGFFPTPYPLAETLIATVNPKKGDKILEPSAGKGALLEALERWRLRNDVKEEEIYPGLRAFEILESNHAHLVRMGWAALCVDFLQIAPAPSFDCIVMNPPFTRGEDVDHVTHALKFLKPGGRLAAIMSAGTKFRSDKKTVAFRELLEKGPFLAKIDDLPEGSFQVSGTNVRTVLVSVFK